MDRQGGRRMQAQGMAVKIALTIGVASLVAGCVQPGYVQPGPIMLQPYPPPVSYRSSPDYRPPVTGPILLQAPPPVQPLPPATPSPSASEPQSDNTGPIPVQDMPAPEATPSAPDAAPAPAAAPPEIIRKIPASGPGNNVPLEGFRADEGPDQANPMSGSDRIDNRSELTIGLPALTYRSSNRTCR